MAYSDLGEAIAAVKALPAVRSLPVTADDAFLNALLVASAGKAPASGASEGEITYPAGTTIYRHYYVGARFLEVLRSQHVLSQAGQNKFTGLAKPIAALMQLQQAMDTALGLIVPDGYEAVPAAEEQQIGGGKVNGLLLGSSSSRSRLVP